MSDICYPPDTDWSCRWTPEELVIQRADEVMGPKIEIAEAFAWSTLAALCLYRIGTCPITVRPCAERCAPPGTWRAAPVRGGNTGALPVGVIGQMNPYITGGRWVNGCGCRQGGCGCSSLSSVILPGPVGSIVSVYLDGNLVARSKYRVDNGNRLVRLDGEAWPACQDLSLSDEDGFSVTYYRGAPPNTLTKAAAGSLANEYLKACEGDGDCALPMNVRSMVRQGESYDLEPVDFAEGTGLPLVDAVVGIYNPNRLKSPVIVASPDDYLVTVPTWR